MRIVIPAEHTRRLIAELQKAGRHEIGGVMMAEDLGGQEFVVREITFPSRAGTWSSFVRSMVGLVRELHRFFSKNGRDYGRFNYLGEWHSHPSFEPVPSTKDSTTMLELVSDPEVGANFAVLLIVRLIDGGITGTTTVYSPDGRQERAQLVFEGVPS